MEFRHTVVRNAVITVERCRSVDAAAVNEQGVRQAPVADHFVAGPWLLHQELLSDRSASEEEDINLLR